MVGKLGMIWSDNIELSANTGWFGGGEINALFQADFISEKYKLIIPFENDNILGERKYTICRLFHNKVFCFPIYGECIWVYHLDRCVFTQINIAGSEYVERMRFSDALIYNKKIYAFARGLRAIVEIEPEKEEISNYIHIPEELGILSGNCFQSHKMIYCSFVSTRSLCEVNVETGEINLYDVPFDVQGINTVNLVGEEEFWFSGFERAIYIWNKRTNKKITLYLPEEFGNYRATDNKELILDYDCSENEDAIFIKSVNLGENIWFIPFRTNKVIFVNKKTYEITILEIDNEEESYNTWNRKMNHKYLVEYIRKDRFIGLYSLKRNKLLEIDTCTYRVEQKRFTLDNESIEKLASFILKNEFVFDEKDEIQKRIFIGICGERRSHDANGSNVGGKIYKKMCDM